MRFVAVLLATVLMPGLSAAPAVASAPDDGVDVFVGSGGHAPWRSGNTTPAAARPFGMLQLGPDTTRDVESGRPSGTASGYAWSDDRIRGFSPIHLSGAGCPAFGDVPVLPVVGRLAADPGTATVPFSHDDESAGPGWYRTRLGNGVSVRLAAALRAGLATYSFPAEGPARLLLKATGSLTGATRARVRFLSRREVAVSATSGGFCGSPTSYRVHVVLRFDRPFAARGRWTGATPGAWVRFDTSLRRSVRTQVAVSFVDVAGARRNLAAANLGWSWARLRRDAVADWDGELGRVRTAGGSQEENAIFGSALRRVLLSPMTLSDADRRYPGFDGRVHRLPPGERHYTALAGWDAYRTQLPLLAWLRPDVASDVVSSLQRAAEQSGWMPRWPLVAMDTGVMNGDSAAPMVAAAYAFGARDFPLGPVVSQLVRQADHGNGEPGAGPGGQR